VALLELEHAWFQYAEDLPALSDVSLAIEPGERVVILGANGCGKTTLLKLFAGLLFPQRGSYRAFGREIRAELLLRDPFGMYFRKEIGVLFQQVDAQLFNPTVEDEVAFGPLQLAEPAARIAATVRARLGQFGVSHLAARAPSTLSGGEKKKVALAAVLAVDPAVLLLDEPTAGLDPRSSQVLIDCLTTGDGPRRTVVTSTNDLHIVPDIADRVVVFGEDRSILASGSPEDILRDGAVLRAANLIHRHRHAHEGYWHAHEHEHPAVVHAHRHEIEGPG
jgi:cobalt/nickel transport system ATP-binding protein